MNKITEIFKAHKYVIIWTIAYIAVMWAILLFMFNFNIFVGRHWQLLMNAEIHGFAGFVFGILVLAALPMYIATTALIIRTNKPLVTVNINPIIKIFNAIIPHPVPANAPATANTDTPQQIADTTTSDASDAPGEEFPRAMPTELRGAFIRARQHIDQYAPSAFNVPSPIDTDTRANNASPNTNDTPSDTGELPLPTDFDFDASTDSDFAPIASMPTFTDINFGDDDDDTDTESVTDDESEPSASEPIDIPAHDFDDANNDIINYLTQKGCNPHRQGDLIIAKDIIIATHSDPEFWIADPENWFAAGKQKTSPVIQLIKASAPLGLRPVLYLASTNIMELDTCRATWDKMGVTTITDLSELPL